MDNADDLWWITFRNSLSWDESSGITAADFGRCMILLNYWFCTAHPPPTTIPHFLKPPTISSYESDWTVMICISVSRRNGLIGLADHCDIASVVWVHKFSKHMPLQQQCSLYLVFVYNFMQVLFVVLAFWIIFLAGNGMDNRWTVVELELVSWWSRLTGHVKSLVELHHMNHSSVFSWLCYCSKACSIDGVGSKCSRMYAYCIYPINIIIYC